MGRWRLLDDVRGFALCACEKDRYVNGVATFLDVICLDGLAIVRTRERTTPSDAMSTM